MIQVEPLRDILSKIETTDYSGVSSPVQLMEYAFKLQQWMAYSGQQMAYAKYDLHIKRKQAMINLIGSLKANKSEMAVTLQREYVNDICADENMLYELADRCNRTCTHCLDMVRSCLSTLKEEMKMTQ